MRSMKNSRTIGMLLLAIAAASFGGCQTPSALTPVKPLENQTYWELVADVPATSTAPTTLKVTSGTLTLTGAQSYSSTTVVSGQIAEAATTTALAAKAEPQEYIFITNSGGLGATKALTVRIEIYRKVDGAWRKKILDEVSVGSQIDNTKYSLIDI